MADERKEGAMSEKLEQEAREAAARMLAETAHLSSVMERAAAIVAAVTPVIRAGAKPTFADVQRAAEELIARSPSDGLRLGSWIDSRMREAAERAAVGLSDYDLRLRAGTATHQHYKGGLYRLVGVVRDAATGDFVRGRDGHPRVLYEHVYPHKRGFWVRDHADFFSEVVASGRPALRFRPLG